jgi:phospholipase C
MKRRTALKYLGALAGSGLSPAGLGVAALQAGCPGSDENLSPDNPRRALGLTNIVVLCMENRSYDEFFGARTLLEGKGGDGLVAGMSNLDKTGKKIEIFHTDSPCVVDPPHGWDSSRAQWNGGKNDGFITAYQDRHGMGVGPEVMGYQTRRELPISYALADAGTICDRWFCSLMGPTWPNRMYLHAAQSGGLKDNTLPQGGLPFPSIWHRLTEAKVPWAYYWSNVPFLALFSDLGRRPEVKRLENDFFNDAENGTLPPVVFLDPAFDGNDDHPPLPTLWGQQLVAAIYGALARSPQWPNTLFVVTYDEHGGFYDHVSPPQVPDDRSPDGFDQLGFRVPTLIAGPYAKIGHVSSVQYDHSSVLAHIEKMFGLQPLTARDAAASPLDDAIDQERLARREPAPPVALPKIELTEAEVTTACKTIARLRATQPSDINRLADSGYFGDKDLRWRERELFDTIARQAQRYGVDMIRK